jgi:phage shock protein PspC (stress-responsive transcriptional regulator)
MNKILNINLGGYALTIDDDAYEYLQAYLESIRRRFSESEGRDEIIGDIEARLGEIISQKMGNRTIVMLPDVEEASSIMGKPEDFGGEDTTDTKKSSAGRSSSGSVPPIRTGKRLLRDEDDAVVAGVCSGLSAYFGIQDPVWMRLSFVLLVFISFGFWVPAYLLMWILLQPAKSAADRLAMRGEPINVDNIAKEVEEGFDRLGNKVNEFGASSKKAGSNAQNVMNTGVNAIGQIFGFFVRFIAKFASIIALGIAILLFLGFGGAWIASIWALLTAAPFLDFFSPFSGGTTWLAFANTFFLLGIPVVALALLFLRVLFKTNVPKWLHGSMWLFWALNLVSALFLGSYAASEYRQSGTITKPIDLSYINSDTLFVEGILRNGDVNDEFWDWDESDIEINNWNLEMKDMVDIRVRRSSSKDFECFMAVSARGKFRDDAQENAAFTVFNVESVDNRLRIPLSYSIPKGKKWKVQKVKVIIGVPKGKFIKFDESINQRAGAEMDDYISDHDGNYISQRPNKLFQMGNDGIFCTDCPKMGDKEYRSERDFEHFILEGDFNTEILDGESFKVRIEGPSNARDLVQTIRTGDKITFTTNGKITNGAVRVIIETPSFTTLYADNTGEVSIRGFDEGSASISAKGSSKIKAYLDASQELELSISNKSTIELTGKGGELIANLSEDAVLDASNWRAENVEVSTSEAAKARVYARNDALILNQGGASNSVRVEGGAKVRTSREQE